MIQVLSRYKAKSEIRDDKLYVVAVSISSPKNNYRIHIASDGDSFEKLAAKYLGAPIFFWRIAELNPQVAFPDLIPVGTKIRIPQ